jgi:hypothetical protein
MGYVRILGDISPTARGANRAADIVAALAPPKAKNALVPAGQQAPTFKKAAMAIVPGVVGAVAGAMLWKRHRILGAVAGHAVVSTAMPIYHGGDGRVRALWQLGIEGAGIASSLHFKRHPFLGWLGGTVGAAGVAALVPNSPAREGYYRLRAHMGW